MAKLEAPTGGSGLQIKILPPPSQYIAVCVRVNDLFNVERSSFQDKNVKEIKDITRFVFGLKGQDGRLYLAQTYEFTISGSPKGNLIKFLTAWLGQNPTMGWDYCEMLGRGAMITIQHKASKTNPGQVYADISGISPVYQQLTHQIPHQSEFEAMVVALENTPPTTNGATPAVPGYPAQAAPAPQLSPDGRFQLVNNQWVPVVVAPPLPPPPAAPGCPTPPPPPPPPSTQQSIPGYPTGAAFTPPAPPAAPAPQLSPDGRFQLVNNQWVPYPGTEGADQEIPF